jgi:hypothetical protein
MAQTDIFTLPPPVEDFDQFSLFAPDVHPTGTLVLPDGPGLKRRGRSYDVAVFLWLKYHYVASVHQLVYRFFLYAGRGPRYGYKLADKLVRSGRLEAVPLDPSKGTTSKVLLRLTPLGWEYFGIAPPKEMTRLRDLDLLDYRLQFVELMLERTIQGWVARRSEPANPFQGFEMLKAAALHRLGPARNSSAQQDQAAIRKLPPVALGRTMLWNATLQQARIVLPIYKGVSYLKVLDGLPRQLKILEPIAFELVCADETLRQKASDGLRRWAAKQNIKYTESFVHPFRTRQHPKDYPGTGDNLYAKAGLPDVRSLVKF